MRLTRRKPTRREPARGKPTRGKPARATRSASPPVGRRGGERRQGGEHGVSTIEVVILAPVIILFILILVAFGQLVDGRGAVDGAARDAARAGSIQRSQSVAMDQATQAAAADLHGTCVGGTLAVTQTSQGFAPDSLYTVQVTCTIRGLNSLGMDVRKTITSSATSPLDPYRRAVAN
jgi:Flp pilus assembly protein TadG